VLVPHANRLAQRQFRAPLPAALLLPSPWAGLGRGPETPALGAGRRPGRAAVASCPAMSRGTPRPHALKACSAFSVELFLSGFTEREGTRGELSETFMRTDDQATPASAAPAACLHAWVPAPNSPQALQPRALHLRPRYGSFLADPGVGSPGCPFAPKLVPADLDRRSPRQRSAAPWGIPPLAAKRFQIPLRYLESRSNPTRVPQQLSPD